MPCMNLEKHPQIRQLHTCIVHGMLKLFPMDCPLISGPSGDGCHLLSLPIPGENGMVRVPTHIGPMRLNLLPLKKTAWFHESCEYLFLPKQISPQKTKPSVLNIIIWATKLPCICHFHQSSLMIRKAAGKVRGAAIDVRGLGTIGEGLVWSASLN